MRWYFLLFLFLVVNVNASKRSTKWLGGGVSLYLPSNTFNGDNSIGFNDVAKVGYGFKGSFEWAFQPTLVLGFETSALVASIDKGYWDVGKYGSIEGKYWNFPFLIQGKYIFSTSDIRPWGAVYFGVNLLHNTLDFSSNYVDNPDFASYSYTTTNFKPSVAPAVGIDFSLDKKTVLSLALRYTYIADLQPTIITLYDDVGYPMVTYVENVHGRQNYFEISAVLQFGLGK